MIGTVCRVARDKNQEGTLVRRAAQHLVQESHRAGDICERDQSRVVKRGNQDPRGDADRLLSVTVLNLSTVWQHTVSLDKTTMRYGATSRKGLCSLVPSDARASSHCLGALC